jgi:hypothetical protein
MMLTAIICDSESVRFHRFVCLSVFFFFIPFVSYHKTRLISANGPKEPGRENKETAGEPNEKKIKKENRMKSGNRKEEKTEQKDENDG